MQNSSLMIPNFTQSCEMPQEWLFERTFQEILKEVHMHTCLTIKRFHIICVYIVEIQQSKADSRKPYIPLL